MRFTIRCEGPGLDESKDSVPSVARYWVIHERFPVSISILQARQYSAPASDSLPRFP